jgi:hypothetical protein
MPVNYQNGKIYKLISPQTIEHYVGSTAQKILSLRMGGHRRSYNAYEAGTSKLYCSSYKLMQYDDCSIILLESFPCESKDQLRAREQHWIDLLKQEAVNERPAYEKDPKKKYYDKNKQIIYQRHKGEAKKWMDEHPGYKKQKDAIYRMENKEDLKSNRR